MSERKRRSKLELKFEDILIANQAEYDYEITVIPYTVPESKHKYTVDWTFTNGILCETKGFLSDHQERNKYVLLKQQYPYKMLLACHLKNLQSQLIFLTQ